MKRIGLVGGTTPESTMYYYSSIIEESRRRFERDFYPEVVIFSINFRKFRLMETWDEKRDYLLHAIRSLESAGAEVIALTANTPHIVFDELQRRTNVKMINIIDSLAEEAKRKGFRNLLLLGTKITMTSGFYVNRLRSHCLEVQIPTEEEMDEVNRIIFEELAQGDTSSKPYLVNLVNRYENLDAVILGCTELPLALRDGDTKIPVLDTAKIHARAIMDAAAET